MMNLNFGYILPSGPLLRMLVSNHSFVTERESAPAQLRYQRSPLIPVQVA